MDAIGPVRVHVRVRPAVEPSAAQCITIDGRSAVIIETPYNPAKVFEYHRVHDGSESDDAIYESVGVPAVAWAAGHPSGGACAVITYGQTNSGKTHTWENLVARAAPSLFHQDWDGDVFVGCVQLHNDTIYDLLPENEIQRAIDTAEGITTTPTSAAAGPGARAPLQALPVLVVREDLSTTPSRFVTHNQALHRASSVAAVMELVQRVKRNRTVAVTRMNSESSRGHVLLTLHLRRVDPNSGAVITSKLCFADLAGSERVGRTKATGSRLAEAQFINTSLSALGNVVHCLAATTTSGTRHIPYRDSKLTRLLQDYLGMPGGLCFLVLTLSPLAVDAGETMSVLKFGERATKIQHHSLPCSAPTSRTQSPTTSSRQSSRRTSPAPGHRRSSSPALPAAARGRSGSPTASRGRAAASSGVAAAHVQEVQMLKARIDELLETVSAVQRDVETATAAREEAVGRQNSLADELVSMKIKVDNAVLDASLKAAKAAELEVTMAELTIRASVVERDNGFWHRECEVRDAALQDNDRELTRLRRALEQRMNDDSELCAVLSFAASISSSADEVKRGSSPVTLAGVVRDAFNRKDAEVKALQQHIQQVRAELIHEQQQAMSQIATAQAAMNRAELRAAAAESKLKECEAELEAAKKALPVIPAAPVATAPRAEVVTVGAASMPPRPLSTPPAALAHFSHSAPPASSAATATSLNRGDADPMDPVAMLQRLQQQFDKQRRTTSSSAAPAPTAASQHGTREPPVQQVVGTPATSAASSARPAGESLNVSRRFDPITSPTHFGLRPSSRRQDEARNSASAAASCMTGPSASDTHRAFGSVMGVADDVNTSALCLTAAGAHPKLWRPSTSGSITVDQEGASTSSQLQYVGHE